MGGLGRALNFTSIRPNEEVVSNEVRRSRAVAEQKAGIAASRATNRRVVLAAAVLVLATAAAYHNSLDGPFIFDDLVCIPQNPTICHLWPMTQAMSPPANGITVSGRPVLNLSLAINYALGEEQVRGYHLTNLVIHVLAGLVLFGIVRRTLLLPSMRDRFGPAAPYLAAGVSLLWMVHPLQTESVTYVVQRAESLMGLFYLLTLYFAIRASVSRPALWSLAAVAVCAMGMATKEVMATAPLIVLLYDRTFLSGSFAGALRKRWGLYVGLFACWGLLAYLMASAGNRGGTAGFGASHVAGWWSYAQAEFVAISHYLRLSLWPDSSCLDYGASTARTLPEVFSGAVVAGLLALGTVWGLLRGRKWGFLGAWFLVILAPTSSVVPLRDPVFEHRMYLSLAAVAAAAVLGAFLLWRKLLPNDADKQAGSHVGLPVGASGGSKRKDSDNQVALGIGRWVAPCLVLAAVAVALGALTEARNNDYRTSLAIWQDTVNKCPGNARAQNNLGSQLCDESRVSEGIEHFREAIRLDPQYAEAHKNLGLALGGQDKFDMAVAELREAVRLAPQYADAYNNLGLKLDEQGKIQEAVEAFRQAIRFEPGDADPHVSLGMALFQLGKLDKAIDEFREAIRLDPRNAKAHNNLGSGLGEQGKFEAAVAEYREAIRLDPRYAQAYENLATVLAKLGRHK